MKNYQIHILFLFFMMVACSESGNEKHTEPLSGPHSEITIQYSSQEIQPNELQTKYGNDYLIQLLKSDSILSEAIIKMGERDSKNDIQKIRERLAFEGVEKTQVWMIHYYHSDEKFANKFLNSLVEELNEELLKSIIAESNKKMEKINYSLDSLSLIIHEYEQEQKEELNEFEMSAEDQDYFTQYLANFQKRKWLVSMITCLEGQEELCLSSILSVGDESDPYLKNALEEIHQLQLEKYQIQLVTVSNSQTQEIDKRKKILKKEVIIYLENVIKTLDHQTAKIQERLNKIPKHLNYKMVPSIKIRNLDREREEKLYYLLIEEKTKLSIERAGIVPPIKILDGPIYKAK